MDLSPNSSISPFDYWVSGDVTIHETAVVAPGVILQASPGTSIAIGAGSCIGMGAVLQSQGGNLEIGAGVTIGTKVLLVGRIQVGDFACIGPSATLFNHQVEASTVIPAGSLWGDPSRPWQAEATQPEDSLPSPWDNEEATSQISESETVPESPPAETPEPEMVTPDEITSPMPPAEKPTVIGQVYINQLIVTLFPERELFKKLS